MRALRLLTLCFPLFLAACPENQQTRGYLKEVDWKEHVVVGAGRDQVMEALGSPSSVSSFGQETWYYITTKRETVGFFKPEVIDQDVTRVTFDKEGKVASVDEYTMKDAKDITIANRETPTEGHQMGFMEQMFGNLGRFNAPGSTPGSRPPPGTPGGR